MKTIRSFLAINVSLESIRQIESTQKELKEKCDAAGIQVRWVPPQNMHITLRFLGNVTEPMIQAVKDNFESLMSKTTPFQLNCADLGTFDGPDGPRILWAGISNEGGELARLHGAVEDILENAGFKRNDKEFSAHVTLGRIKESPENALSEIVKEYENISFGKSRIREFLCYRSDLKTSGTDYHLLWRLIMTGRVRQEQRTDNQSQAQDSAREQN